MIHAEPNWANHLRLYRDRINGGTWTAKVVPYADTFTHADVWYDELRATWRVTVFDRDGRIVGKDDEYQTKAEAQDTAIAYIDSGRLASCRVFSMDDKTWIDVRVRK